MSRDPAFTYANLVNQRQAANYGSIVDLLVQKGIVTLDEVHRARARSESAVDQVMAGDMERLAELPEGQIILGMLGRRDEDDDDA